MIRRTVLEWGRLPYGEEPGNPGCIPPEIADRLAAAAEATRSDRKGARVLDHGRHALGARGTVGVVAADECQLEILPKIGRISECGGNDLADIRKQLVHMLAVAWDLQVDVGALTRLDWQRSTLLDVVIRLFADQLMEAVRRGMPRQYRSCEDDLPALRGSLNITRQFTRHAVDPSRLACRFDVLSEDIPLNRIMKAAVFRLMRLPSSPETKRRLQELGFVYADISSVPVQSLRWDLVRLDRTNRRWQHLLDFARRILGDEFQSTSSGASTGHALLFEMNVLFEEYVGRMLCRAYQGTGLSVSLQGGRKYCLCGGDQRERFQTRPDILIRKGPRVVHIIDTKWKRIAAEAEHPKQGVSQADVYQMMAYSKIYDCPRVTLLYPHHEGLGSEEKIHQTFEIRSHDSVLETASIDVSRQADIAGRLRGMLGGPTECLT